MKSLSMLAVVLVLATAAWATDPFMIVAVPDTQFYSESYPATFSAQTQWIVDHKSTSNIAFVTQLGDITNDGTSAGQWSNALTAMNKLNGVVPYSTCFGNHDLHWDTGGDGVANSKFYFGDAAHQGGTSYGGVSPNGLSFYQTFSAGGFDFLHINLNFSPDPNTLNWAQSVISSNSGKATIISTHDYLNIDGNRDSVGNSIWNTPLTDHPNGLVYGNSQVFMVLNGHYHGEAQLISTDAQGNKVAQIVSDYQGYANGGSGYLREMTFDPDNGQIRIKTYSPTLGAYETDTNSQFTYSATFNQAANTIMVNGLYDPGHTTLIDRGATWKYLHPTNGVDPGVGGTFMRQGFDDSGWASGPAALGYGQSDQGSFVKTDIGTPPNGQRYSAYFRKAFEVTNPAAFGDLTVDIARDDGAIVYLNGTELFRTNMPGGAVGYTTMATVAIGGTDEVTYYTFGNLSNLLVAGTNVLAVELHNGATTSSDLSFDMDLVGANVPEPASLTLLILGGLAALRRRSGRAIGRRQVR